METTYTIPEVERESIHKALDRFQKKAIAYGKNLHVQLGIPYAMERNIYDELGKRIGTELIEVFDATIECEVIRKDGYSVIAKIEHLDGGNVVKTIGLDRDEMNPAWSDLPPKCDHCGTNHNRRITFIVRHEDGSEKQVGRSCLKDYCGINPDYVLWLNQVQDLFLHDDVDYYDFDEKPVPAVYSTISMLALARRIVERQGYVKSSDPNSNRMALLDMCDQYYPSQEDQIEAQQMAETILAMNKHDSMIVSIQSLIRNKYCASRHFGFIAYAPIVYKNRLEELERQAMQAKERELESNSDYVGEIGERLTVQVSKINLITSWENDYGCTFLYKIIDKEGNVLVWFASKPLHGIDGCTAIKATVKNHSERDGVKQTVVTRCKVA